MASADSDVSPSPRARCSSCSKESRIKLNSCAGCLNAPSYGGDVPRPAVYYCSAQCQRSHWRTHKTECKVLQTRRCIHRAALVLGSFVGIVEAKGDMAMARLAVFMTELFKDIPVIVQEAVVNVINEPAETSPRESHAYKITTNTDDSDETWAIVVERPHPPTEWAHFISENHIDVKAIHQLGFHRRNLSPADLFTVSFEFDVRALAEAREGKMGWFLKGTNAQFDKELKSIVAAERDSMGVIKRRINSGMSTPITQPAITSLYKIQPTRGKGMAMFASIPIKKGTRILCEAPTVVLAGKADFESGIRLMDKQITQQLTKLDLETRIAKTNALPFGPAGAEGGVFLDASRINHSCANNAENIWNPRLKKLTIQAIRDIPAGKEITISYIWGFNSYEERRRHLFASFGFHCGCTRCGASLAERKESDQRRKRLQTLEDEIGDGMGIVRTPLACVHKVYEMTKLLEEDGLAGSTIPRVYHDAFQIAIAHGDQARAKVFAERCYAARVLVDGEDSEDAAEARVFVERPSSHRLYGTTMKWKQGVGKVPTGLSEEAFERWLWKK